MAQTSTLLRPQPKILTTPPQPGVTGYFHFFLATCQQSSRKLKTRHVRVSPGLNTCPHTKHLGVASYYSHWFKLELVFFFIHTVTTITVVFKVASFRHLLRETQSLSFAQPSNDSPQCGEVSQLLTHRSCEKLPFHFFPIGDAATKRTKCEAFSGSVNEERGAGQRGHIRRKPIHAGRKEGVTEMAGRTCATTSHSDSLCLLRFLTEKNVLQSETPEHWQ